MASNQEDEILGKAYDGRLMRRLLTYLRPYKWHVIVALAAIILKSGLDVLGPFLTKVAIDKYLAKSPNSHSWLGDRLSSAPLTGIAQIGGLYVGILVWTFVLEFVQTYLMQWTGQKVMFDLRSQIFRHLQLMHVGFLTRIRSGVWSRASPQTSTLSTKCLPREWCRFSRMSSSFFSSSPSCSI